MDKVKRESENNATVYLSLGANLGDRLLNLREGILALASHEKIDNIVVSSIYETDPQGLEDQPLFYNIAACIQTTLTPHELLELCHKIEDRFSRDRSVRWGPRPLDIDILTYDALVLDEPDLVIPHPRMQEREFVQIPLLELKTGKVACSKLVRPVYSNWLRLSD